MNVFWGLYWGSPHCGKPPYMAVSMYKGQKIDPKMLLAAKQGCVILLDFPDDLRFFIVAI